MSYRVYVNDYQCLGNNEFPEVLRKALNNQGAKIYPSNDYVFHNFEIKELQPIIEALEQYIIDMNKWALKKQYKPGSIADFSNIFNENEKGGNGLTWRIQEHLECGYLFITVNFLNAIKDDYEEDYSADRITYRIKEGHHVFMSGY